MNNIIFLGGGGFFNELYEYISEDIALGRLTNVQIKGIVDDRILEHSTAPYLGKFDDYQIEENDYFIVAIGNAMVRKKIFNLLKNRNAQLYTYIHSTALISKSCQVGEGVIICPSAIVNANTILEEGVVLNVFCSVGHDSKVGAYTVMSPYSAVNGGSIVGSGCFLGTRATVFPQSNVGNNVIIDSHSYAKNSVESNTIVSLRFNYQVIKNRLLER